MKRHSVISRSAVGVTAAVIFIGAAVAVAAPFTGSPAALRLAHAILAQERRNVAVLWHQHGGVFDCPGPGQVSKQFVAPRSPSPRCHPASVRFEQNLRSGYIVAQITTVTATGIAPETRFDNTTGSWVTYGHTGCWHHIGSGFRQPAASFAGERLSIAGRRGRVVKLRGTSRGFRELDTVDARTDEVTALTTVASARGGVVRIQSRFSYPRVPFALPTPTPLCAVGARAAAVH